MATTRSQRIGIWVIALAMIIGTVAGFVAMILAPQNEAADNKQTQEVMAQYQKDITAYQAKKQAQADELSKKYYDEFAQYASIPAAFEVSEVQAVATNDLKPGDGEEIKKDTAYDAYYIGWNPTGKVFDQSIDGAKLKSPIQGGNLIPGWNEGVVGMKVGGVREITIPADKAYGATGSGEDIPPNTPLKFIVMIIPKVDTIAQPKIPEALRKAYGGQ